MKESNIVNAMNKNNLNMIEKFIQTHVDNHITHSFIGGTLTAIVVNINIGHTLETIFYSAVGTLISLFLSLAVKNVLKKWFQD